MDDLVGMTTQVMRHFTGFANILAVHLYCSPLDLGLRGERFLHLLAQKTLPALRELGRRRAEHPFCQTCSSRFFSSLLISSPIPLEDC